MHYYPIKRHNCIVKLIKTKIHPVSFFIDLIKIKSGGYFLLWWNNLPYAEVLDGYVICIIPSEGGRWSSPSYDLIWFSSTFTSTTSPSSRVNKLVYLLPFIAASSRVWINVNPGL